jgi:glycosyltransferase involved in cell wall biosynthesis
MVMPIPKISVVIPFLNMGRFLPAAAESVEAQTFPDWEMIIVDDGSRLEELAVARTVAETHPDRIRVLPSTGKPTGASAARNRGIRAARGEYLALLDSDDVWLPAKLSHQLDKLGEFPEAAMTFARVRYFSEDEGFEEFDQPFPPLQAGLYPPPKVLPIFLRHPEVYPCPSATLIRMQAIRGVGGFEESFRKIRTDLAAWTKLAARFPVAADDAVLGRYRQHAGSSVSESGRTGMDFTYDRRYYEWALRHIEGLPAENRRGLEPILCEKMLYYAVQDSLSRGVRSSIGWRWDVGRRLIRYPAFRRKFRWFRAIALKVKTFKD